MAQELNGDKMEMNTNEGSFVSSKGHNLFCRYWGLETTSEELRCLVFVCHGVGEHSVWYDHLAKKLVGKGCLVFAHDHVGHGKSDGDRVHVDDFSVYCDDVATHVNSIKQKHQNNPCFIIGHSMGGTIAILTALNHQELFSGVLLIGPAILPDYKNVGFLKVFAARLVGKFVPQFQVGPILPEWISSDARVCKKYTEDPLVWHGGLKAKWACCILDAMETIQRNIKNITFPFLLLHGSEDKICSLEGSTLMQEKSSSEDKTLKIYEGAFHQVHSEPGENGERAVNDILDWITFRSTPIKTQF